MIPVANNLSTEPEMAGGGQRALPGGRGAMFVILSDYDVLVGWITTPIEFWIRKKKQSIHLAVCPIVSDTYPSASIMMFQLEVT